MKKPIAIIAGEPNSISSEIIFKCWMFRKKYNHVPFFIIGSIHLLNLQKKKMKFNFKIKKIKEDFKVNALYGNELPVYNVLYKQKKAFEELSNKSNKYIFNCFDITLNFIKKNKIIGFINCPIAKEFLFRKKYQGITEFLASRTGRPGNEVMLIFNKKLAVAPITTHIPIKLVSKYITKNLITKKIKIINSFYKKFLRKKPNIGVLGLNPHNYTQFKPLEEKIIIKAINEINKKNPKVIGPISPDTSFMMNKSYKFDVIIGMYHDQVLTPYKALFSYDAINITLGLPFIRISPDHGTAINIVGKKIANHKSLLESIKFFNIIK